MEARLLEGTVNAAFDSTKSGKGTRKPPLRMVFVLMFVMCLFFVLTLFENIMATFFNVVNNSELLKVLTMLKHTKNDTSKVT